MNRTALRLTGFAVLLAVLFTGGWAAGAQFPIDDQPAPHETDHTTDDHTTDDHTTDDHTTDDHTSGDHTSGGHGGGGDAP